MRRPKLPRLLQGSKNAAVDERDAFARHWMPYVSTIANDVYRGMPKAHRGRVQHCDIQAAALDGLADAARFFDPHRRKSNGKALMIHAVRQRIWKRYSKLLTGHNRGLAQKSRRYWTYDWFSPSSAVRDATLDYDDGSPSAEVGSEIRAKIRTLVWALPARLFLALYYSYADPQPLRVLSRYLGCRQDEVAELVEEATKLAREALSG